MSRQQRLEKGLQMSRRLIELQDEQDWSCEHPLSDKSFLTEYFLQLTSTRSL